MRKPPLRCPDWGSDRGRKNPRDSGSVLPALVQVNLMRKMWVTGVVTQGASRAGSAEYLKTFKVAYSTDGRQFQFIHSALSLFLPCLVRGDGGIMSSANRCRSLRRCRHRNRSRSRYHRLHRSRRHSQLHR